MHKQFNDVNNSVYNIFENEWFEKHNFNPIRKQWCSFINEKELGIECMYFTSIIYNIVDEKKWIITRLKYGI
jgi:hypothetical protein